MTEKSSREEIRVKRLARQRTKRLLSRGYSAVFSGDETFLKRYCRLRIDGLGQFNPRPDKVVYLLGSPGSGKTVLLRELNDQLEDTRFEPEARVWHVYRASVISYFRQHGQIDENFRPPFIDGLHYYDGENLDGQHQLRGLTEKDIVESLRLEHYDYGDVGNPILHAYREAKINIRSGGKSAFPDFLFYRVDGEKRLIVSIPGHYQVADVVTNKSLPEIPTPDEVVYLIDPLVSEQFARRFGVNIALEKCHLHLEDAIFYERRGIPVHWFLSKTPEQVVENEEEYREDGVEPCFVQGLELRRATALQAYSNHQGLEEIARRIPDLHGFDSLETKKDELLSTLSVLVS